jgi:DNA-binding transcriptional LysR family regulator
MAEFLQNHPGMRYVQLRGDSQQIHQFISQGKSRLGFVGMAADPRNFHYLPIATDRLVLITPNREPYATAHREGISGMALLDQPMILREASSGTRQELEQFLHRQGKSAEDLQVIAQIDNPEAIKSSVIRGLGVSVISVLAAREEVLSGRLLAFELGDRGAFRKIYLAWSKQASLSEPEQLFLNFIRNRPVT